MKKIIPLAVVFSLGTVSYANAQQTGYQPYYEATTSSPAQTSVSNVSYAAATPTPTGLLASRAGAFSPIGDRIVSDPLYLPLTGQIYGQSSYTFGIPTHDGYNAGGTQKHSITGNSNTAAQTLSYGVSDEFSLHATESYSVDSNDSTASSTGVQKTTDSNGFSNPIFGATWRVIDEARHNNPVDLDLSIDYSPDAFTDSAGAPGHDGTVASGNQQAEFLATVGREMKDLTLTGSASATYIGTGSYQSSASGDLFSQSQSFDYNLNVNSQTRLTDRTSFNLGTGYTFVNQRSAMNNTTGSSWVNTGANFWSINTALNYHIIPNRLVAGLTYVFDDFENSGTNYPNPNADTSSQNHYDNVIGVRLQYAFN